MNGLTLEVVTHRSWVAEELSSNTLAEVHHSFGLSIPKYSKDCAWWLPTEYAARFSASGVNLKLAAPHPDLLSLLPESFLGREVITAKVAEASFSGSGWVKPADIKLDTLPARFYSDAKTSLEEAKKLLPPDSLLQFTSTTLEVRAEFRFYVCDHEVVTGSLYLADGLTYYEGVTFDGGFQECESFAANVAKFLDSQNLAPEGYVLDVALTTSGPVVLEFNPAWSSAFYGSDINAVVETLFAASKATKKHVWQPDPYLANRAARMRPLSFDS